MRNGLKTVFYCLTYPLDTMFICEKWTFFLILVAIHETGAILCYFCADATDNEDLADCIHKTDRMQQHRTEFESDPDNKKLEDYKYLKNCSHYVSNSTQEELYQYCKIEQIGAYGQVNAFIRDCSNKENFSPVNVTILDFLKPDNQTICGYSHLQFATICVRVCTGDFCNGPTAGTNLRASTVSLGLLAFGTVLCRIIIRGT